MKQHVVTVFMGIAAGLVLLYVIRNGPQYYSSYETPFSGKALTCFGVSFNIDNRPPDGPDRQCYGVLY